jgi:hypothetical protein
MAITRKAKGREWPTLRIAADFHEPRRSHNGTGARPSGRRLAGLYLAYIAVTRAGQTLDPKGCPGATRGSRDHPSGRCCGGRQVVRAQRQERRRLRSGSGGDGGLDCPIRRMSAFALNSVVGRGRRASGPVTCASVLQGTNGRQPVTASQGLLSIATLHAAAELTKVRDTLEFMAAGGGTT